MTDIRIIEYDPLYAKGLAEMWNKSGSSWGGDNTTMTEEQTLAKKDVSPNLNMYLALDGEQVVGFCSLSEYREDEGSLYIPLLNVIPEYHGKKIGKALVLQVLERTIELGWPRLDLYTWPGNTKAVPLYKKCGFFWERRNDSTHLMNFIPTVLQTEAVAEFFRKVDWYQDSKREIKIQPDALEVNDFECYEYLWEKNGSRLRMEFERRSRGLRLIETDDYLVSAIMPKQKLVFGRSYKIIYQVVNKTADPLHIVIKGLDDKNIKFDFDLAIDVQDQQMIEGEFTLGEIKAEYSKWRTHPAVSADVYINGQHALFRLGVIPQFPAKLSLVSPTNLFPKNRQGVVYLDIENNFDEMAKFNFTLPSTDWLSFNQSEFVISMQSGEKRSIPVAYILEDFSFYSEEISIEVTLASGEIVEFVKELNTPFPGNTGMVGGETEKSWVIYNGGQQVSLYKNNNIRSFTTINQWESTVDYIFLNYPQFGKPYSLEFSKTTPKKVEYVTEDDAMVLRATYCSKDFEGLELVYVTRLFASGIVENYYEIHNNSDQISDEVYLKEVFRFDFSRGILPFNGELLEIVDTFCAEPPAWGHGEFTENWLFSYGHSISRGIWWSPEYKVMVGEYPFEIELCFGQLPAKSTIKTKPISFAIGTFRTLEEFRNFVRGSDSTDYLPVKDVFTLEVNGNNPFVQESFEVKAIERRNFYFEGQLTLNSESNAFEPQVLTYTAAQKKKEAEFAVKLSEVESDVITLDADMELFGLTRQTMVFKMESEQIKTEIGAEEGLKVLIADNGKLRIKAAPEFSHALFSLTHNGHEWFESSFPKAGPRSWFNPWVGGLALGGRGLSESMILQEKITGEFVEREDIFDNKWTGIKTKIQIDKNEEFRGLEIEQSFLMMPGVPILACQIELISNLNRTLKDLTITMRCFFKPFVEELTEGWFVTKDVHNQFNRYKTGKGSIELLTKSPVLFGANTHQDRLLFCMEDNSLGFEAFTNMVDAAIFYYQPVNLQNQKKITLPVMFLIFTDQYIEEDLIKNLRRVRFI